MKKELTQAILSCVTVAMLSTFSAFAQNVKGAEALSNRQQSIVAIAALSGNGNLSKLETAVNEGLDSGLTVNEIGEIMLQTYAYAGFPRSLNAQQTLQKVLDERKAKGITDIYGGTPAAVPETNRYDIGRENINTLINGKATQSRPTDTGYGATTDVFLKEHLFADIIERNNLEYKDRELVTVGILSGLMTVNPQLGAHINGAINLGNTEEQIQAAVKVLSAKVSKKTGKNAQKVLNEVLESRKSNNQAQNANSQDANNQVYPPQAQVSVFPVGNPNSVFAKYFTGDSFVSPLFTDGLFVANVTFEPGCINNWHTHNATTGGGQLLIAVGGRGYYQLEGQEPVEMNPGDVALMPANVKHWHGAAKDSWFSHISVEVPGTDGSTDWFEAVNQDDYKKLK